MKKSYRYVYVALLTAAAGVAHATPFTTTSPAGGALPTGVTEVGGVVLDLVGANNIRVVSQLSATSLFVGFYNDGVPVAYRGNPGTIGIQTGFTQAVLDALGGGIQQAAVRITLYDGDTATGNFDYNDNTLLLNGINFGNWSSVNAQTTNNTGTVGGSFSGGGFRNDTLDTGWFYSNNAAQLANLYTSLAANNRLTYQVQDTDPYDNYYDFTQGVAGGLIDVGQPPTPIQAPEPASLALFSLGLAGLLPWRRRWRRR